MKFTKHILTSAVLLATSSFAIAATDTTDIEINVTKDAYVNLTGSLSGNTVVALSEAEVNDTATTLGTLGSESNTAGECDILIESDNDFELLHTGTSVALHSGAKYDVDWAGTNYTSGAANTATFLSCDQVASNVVLNTPPITALVVDAGTYADTLTVTITTQ